MATALATERRPGAPFDDQRTEMLAQGIVAGMSLSVAAAQAGISPTAAVKVRKTDEFMARLTELRSKMATITTMSLASIAVELENTAREARGEKQYKAALECYRLLREMLKADGDALSGIGQALPCVASERRAELQRRLRGENPIHGELDTTATEVDDDEAAQ